MGLIADKSPIRRATKRLDYADAGDFTPSGDFTFELFDVVFSATTQGTLLSHYNATGGNRSWQFEYSGTAIRFLASLDGSALTTLSHTWTPTLGTPYQIAAERSGTTLRLYLDGVMVASATLAGAFKNPSADLTIGTLNGASGFAGDIGPLRLTQGHARYATDTSYTVPSRPLPTS